MGVDYSGIGGIGVKVEDWMIDQFVENGLFSYDEWSEMPTECMEKIGLMYSVAGSYYSGYIYYYLLVEGENLCEINNNAMLFLSLLWKNYGINLDKSDLKVISDTLCY